jgi:prophage regulatory protein
MDTPMRKETQNKAMIRQMALCDWLDLSRSGLDKLRKKDPSFPRPLKDGDARQAAAFYVVAEVQSWLQSKIEARDAANAPVIPFDDEQQSKHQRRIAT